MACKDHFEFGCLLPGLGEYSGNNRLSLRGGLSVLHHFAATLFADPAPALMDSGRCPARPPLLKQQAFSGAFHGGGGRRLFISLRGLWRQQAEFRILLLILICII